MGISTTNRRRRGNAAVTAISLTALLGFGALAVDMGWLRAHNLQLSVAVDAAAVGGVGYLDGTLEGVERAVERAVWLANSNPIYSSHTFSADDVTTGAWDPESRTFTPIAPSTESAPEINALQVQSVASSIPVVLAGVAFGRSDLSTRAEATAFLPLGGATSSVDCFLPLALPACLFPEEPTVNPGPMTVSMGNNNTDDVAWAFPEGVNASTLRDHLLNPCSSGRLSLGDTMEVMNGVTASVAQTVAQLLNEHAPGAETWPEELGEAPPREEPWAFAQSDSRVQPNRWGNVLAGAIALIDVGGEPGTCAGADNFTGTRDVRGFTWAALYDVRDGNASDRGFKLQLDFLTERELGWRSSPTAIGNVTAPYGTPSLVL